MEIVCSASRISRKCISVTSLFPKFERFSVLSDDGLELEKTCCVEAEDPLPEFRKYLLIMHDSVHVHRNMESM